MSARNDAESATSAPPRASVLLPYRDAADTLREALESTLADLPDDAELLAVDDGSRDGGPELVASLARDDARIRALHAPGLGIVGALECARTAAKGALLYRMDADDIWLPGRAAAQRAQLDAQRSLGAVGTRVEGFPAELIGAGLARYISWQNALRGPAQHARERFIESPICHPSACFRASALDAIGGYREGPFPEDYDVFLRLVAAGYGLDKVTRLGLRWRHREGRLSFTDPRCSTDAFRALRAAHLASVLRGGTFWFWGAGREGKRLIRALGDHGVAPARVLDVDPKKFGRRVGEAVVCSFETLAEVRAGRDGGPTIVACVGNLGARAEIRAYLDASGRTEGVDYWLAA